MTEPDPSWRSAALERDALRLLTVLHQLGREVEMPGFAVALDGETHLLRLDHLVRHPLDLAYVVVDATSSAAPQQQRRRAAQRAVRRLWSEGERGVDRRFRHRFNPGSWERRDDALSLLVCRGLAVIRPSPEPESDLRYLLAEAAARRLETEIYPRQPTLAPILERCAVVRDFLAYLDPGALAARLEQLAQRLGSLRREEQVPLEEDLLPRLFFEAFGEPL